MDCSCQNGWEAEKEEIFSFNWLIGFPFSLTGSLWPSGCTEKYWMLPSNDWLNLLNKTSTSEMVPWNITKNKLS